MQKIVYYTKDFKTNVVTKKVLFVTTFKSAVDISRQIKTKENLIGKPIIEQVA